MVLKEFLLVKIRDWFPLLVTLSLASEATAQTTLPLDHFEFSTITSPKVGFVPFRVIITARATNGTTARSFAGTVQLTAAAAGGAEPVETLTPLQFTSGLWVGNLAVNTTNATTVTLTVVDTAGHRGDTAPITIQEPPFRIIDLPVVSLASDRIRGLLYASLGPPSLSAGQIAVVDPVTGLVQEMIPVQGGAGRLELANDASVLYAATDDSLRIRRLRLPDFGEELVLDLGDWEAGSPNYVDDMAVAPGHPEVLAVTKQRRHISPRFTGLSVFDNGVEKTPVAPAFVEANAVAFGATADRLYAYYNESTAFNLLRLVVNPIDLQLSSSQRNLINGFGAHIRFAERRLYATTGRVIDPETFALLGEIPGGHQDALILPLDTAKRVAFLTPNSTGVLLVYDLESLRLAGTVPFPVPRGTGSGLVAWGGNGLAFHDGVRLVLLESELLPSDPAADLETTAVTARTGPVPIGSAVEMEARIRNLGPNPANAVVAIVDGPSDTVLTAASAVGGACTVTDRQVRCELDSLAVGAEVRLKFTAHAAVAAWFPFAISTFSRAVDPDGTNNSAAVVLTAGPPLGPDSYVVFRVGTGELAVDRQRGRLLATTAAQAGPFGSSIVSIDPLLGEVGPPRFVGNRPSQLAVSDDGQYLYVGYDGLAEVRRFELPDLRNDLTIPLGADGFAGVRFANDIAVRPGHPTEISVTRRTFITGNSSDGMAFFRDGQALVEGIGQGSVNFVAFSSSSRLYAYGDSFGLLRLGVDDTGLQSLGFLQNVVQAGTSGFTVANARIYFPGGSVFDTESGQAVGQFNGLSVSTAAPLVNSASQRAVFIERGPFDSTLAAYDASAFTRVGSNLLAGVSGAASSLCRWGEDGLAFRTSGGVVMVRTTLAGVSEQAARFESVAVNGGLLVLRLSAPTTGLYRLEHALIIGDSWSAVGEPFAEGTRELQIPLSTATQEFFRVVRQP